MDKISNTLIVFFEDPFWVGIIEEINNNSLAVSRILFYQEPKDYEIYEYVLEKYNRLKFSPTVEKPVKPKCLNPKRMQKIIQNEINANGIGTKSQQALKKLQELNKQERVKAFHQQKEDEKKKRYALKQQKRKAKHRGK